MTLRLPDHLRSRALALARWRRTSLSAVVRRALEHYLDEGVDGRAACAPAARTRPPPPPRSTAIDDAAAATTDASAAELARAYADGRAADAGAAVSVDGAGRTEDG